MHKLVNALNASNRCERKTDPKVVSIVWQMLADIDSQGLKLTKNQYMRHMCAANEHLFHTPGHLKTTVDGLIDDGLIGEDDHWRRGRRKGFRFVPLYDRRRFFGRTNDWFCFHCHTCGGADQNGRLVGCGTCFRAIHTVCMSSGADTNASAVASDDFVCAYCRRLSSLDTSGHRLDQMTGEELQTVLEVFYTALEHSFVDFDVYENYSLPKTKETDVLLFYYMDLTLIRRKVFELKCYQTFLELEYDLRHFCHNFAVVKDVETIAPFVTNIDFEGLELRRCVDCYLCSKAPVGQGVSADEWFTRVCAPVHRLVYAKCRNHPFWPAKVLEEHGDQCLVQFFEHKTFSRALVANANIKDIEHKFEGRHYRRSAPLMSAIGLLLTYLKNLRSVDENFKYEPLFRRLGLLLATNGVKRKYPVLKDVVINGCVVTTADGKRKQRSQEFDYEIRDNVNEEDVESVYYKSNIKNNENDRNVKILFTRIVDNKCIEKITDN